MNTGPFGSVGTPVFTPRMIPKRPVQFPCISVIFRFEQTAGHRSTPHDPRLIRSAGRHGPNQFERPVQWLVEEWYRLRHVALRHWRILRSWYFVPAFRVVGRPLQFDAKVTVV